jgi:hypothetical protein
MASPFAVFRRNQKILTVVLTCLAMFAFIILDSVSKMDSSVILPILFGLVGAGLAWMWGSQNERGISYPTIAFGAVAGAIAGAVMISQMANQGGLQTAHGRITNDDLQEMKQKRETVNQFVVRAFRTRKAEVHPMMANYYLNNFMFGDTSSRGVVTTMLLEHEADELGIQVSDEYITDFIKNVSDNDLTREALTRIRTELLLGESELYDLLRSELRARIASRILNPEVVHMPDQYWSDFEKLNVRHSIDAVAIPVEPFAAALPRPSDSELNEIFEAFKGVFPAGENPGFVQPNRLKLAWFESDYESAEKVVGEISEEDLKARYEERKEIEYKIETLPDLDAGFDNGGLKFGEPPAPVKTTPPAGDAEPSGEAAGDAAKTDKSEVDPAAKTDKPVADPAAKPDDDVPSESPKNDDSSSTDSATPTETETPTEDETTPVPASNEDSGDQASESSPAGDQKDDKPAAKSKTEVADENAVEKPEPAANAKPVVEKPATETPAETAPVVTEDAAKDPVASPLSEIKYRSYEEVRDEIRDLMLREKTEEQIEKQIAAAMTAVKDWRFSLRENSPEITDEDLAKAIAAKATAYAAEKGLKFLNIAEFQSQQELIDHKEYRIGTAREPFDPSNFMSQTQPQTVAARLFTGAATLFVPEEAQGQFDDTRYAFWATGEKEQHVPTLDEHGVREQVEKAVRLKNARPVAEARAKKLAEAVAAKFAESSIVSLTEGIAGESVSGKASKKEAAGDGKETTAAGDAKKSDPVQGVTKDNPTDESLSVVSSPPFTWYRQSSQGMQMNPFAQPTIEFGVIPGIDGVDNNFMQTVTDTPVGGVVVIPNATKQVYYVVYVKARNPSGTDDPGLAPIRQQFITENVPMSQVYGQLAGSQAADVNRAWLTEFLAKHNVDLAELDAI